jgi:uncharacterized RDD family membrane protein YckC
MPPAAIRATSQQPAVSRGSAAAAGRSAAAVPGQVRAVPAPLWKRGLAWAVDLGTLGALFGLYLLAGATLTGKLGGASSQLDGLDLLMLKLGQLESLVLPGLALMVLLAGAYSACGAYAWAGQTLGRQLVGIVLVDRTGLSPTRNRAIVRAVLSFFSFVVFLAGFWLVLFDRRRQTLHDKLTGTFVVELG